jgi:hypothetical protein
VNYGVIFAKDVVNKRVTIITFDNQEAVSKKSEYFSTIFLAGYFSGFIGFFDDFSFPVNLFYKKSCTVFLYAYYDPPCSKQNELQSE